MAQTTRRPLCDIVCVFIWSDVLEGENKCKSHIAQSLSECSINHVFKSGQNRKVIILQVFQFSQSNISCLLNTWGKARHPGLFCCYLLLIYPESVSPNPGADRGCPRRYFLSPLENASYKRKMDLPGSLLAASAGPRAQVSWRANFPWAGISCTSTSSG